MCKLSVVELTLKQHEFELHRSMELQSIELCRSIETNPHKWTCEVQRHLRVSHTCNNNLNESPGNPAKWKKKKKKTISSIIILFA